MAPIFIMLVNLGTYLIPPQAANMYLHEFDGSAVVYSPLIYSAATGEPTLYIAFSAMYSIRILGY
eukprot:scaffold2758_cov101-Isochrysis_galbana.AAC.1